MLSAHAKVVARGSREHSKGCPAAQGVRTSFPGISPWAEYLVVLALKYRPMEIFLAKTPE